VFVLMKGGAMGIQLATTPDLMDTVVSVLDLVRSGAARTRPEIARLSGLGRNVVTQRVSQLLDAGLVAEGDIGRSTGGRAPRELRFCSDAGHVLVLELGATSISVAIADLSGSLEGQVTEPADVTDGPEPILGRAVELFDKLLGAQPVEVWGVGVGLPGPVEFTTGRPVAPPIMPGWDGYDVRAYFADRYDAPVWVDNDVNVMVLGELRDGLAQGMRDVVYVKVGSGIGAGLVSAGHLHRGAQGCAGDIGHIAAEDHSHIICRCGQTGCLEALAGGAALARDGLVAAQTRRSPYLAKLAKEGRTITATDVGHAALRGDPYSVQLVTYSAKLVGESLSRIVNFFNPSLILIGGGVSDVGDLYLASVRQEIFSRSLPLATRSLKIERSPLGDTAGLKGAAFMVIDELLSRERLGLWIERRTPAGQPALSA
jgi:glucokinase-like ROK family protein